MAPRIVLDTNVFVSALLGPRGASRALVRACLMGIYQPLMGTTLFLEYEAVMAREPLFAGCHLTNNEREALLDAFLSVCHWQKVYYAWRPNLPDEADNHVIELAIAGGATAIVTYNTRDFARAELYFPGLRIVRPAALVLEE
jgi:putative PIN family toxin of toxin-antitoxin system